MWMQEFARQIDFPHWPVDREEANFAHQEESIQDSSGVHPKVMESDPSITTLIVFLIECWPCRKSPLIIDHSAMANPPR